MKHGVRKGHRILVRATTLDTETPSNLMAGARPVAVEVTVRNVAGNRITYSQGVVAQPKLKGLLAAMQDSRRRAPVYTGCTGTCDVKDRGTVWALGWKGAEADAFRTATALGSAP